MRRFGLGLLGCLMLAATGCCCGGSSWSCVDACDTWGGGCGSDCFTNWLGSGCDSGCDSNCDSSCDLDEECPCCGRSRKHSKTKTKHRRSRHCDDCAMDPCCDVGCNFSGCSPAVSGPVSTTYGAFGSPCPTCPPYGYPTKTGLYMPSNVTVSQAPVMNGPVVSVPYGSPAYGAPAFNAPAYGAQVFSAPVVNGQIYNGQVYTGPVLGTPIVSDGSAQAEGVVYDSAWNSVPPPAAPAPMAGLNEPAALPPAVPGTQPVATAP